MKNTFIEQSENPGQNELFYYSNCCGVNELIAIGKKINDVSINKTQIVRFSGVVIGLISYNTEYKVGDYIDGWSGNWFKRVPNGSKVILEQE